jgi:hypothetical protein
MVRKPKSMLTHLAALKKKKKKHFQMWPLCLAPSETLPWICQKPEGFQVFRVSVVAGVCLSATTTRSAKFIPPPVLP